MGGRQTTAANVSPSARQAGVTDTITPAGHGTSRAIPIDGLFQHSPATEPSTSGGYIRSYRAIGLGIGQQSSQRVSNVNRNVGTRQSVHGSSTPDSDDSTPDEGPLNRELLNSSLPLHLFSFRDIKCPVCGKLMPPDDVECHLVMCLTKPRINYNEDVLNENKGECVICLEDLYPGDTIARLPCLCIYHKSCIDDWFKVRRSCPEHPND